MHNDCFLDTYYKRKNKSALASLLIRYDINHHEIRNCSKKQPALTTVADFLQNLCKMLVSLIHIKLRVCFCYLSIRNSSLPSSGLVTDFFRLQTIQKLLDFFFLCFYFFFRHFINRLLVNVQSSKQLFFQVLKFYRCFILI